MSLRHTAGFGKRIEFWIIGELTKEGLDVYVPLVDNMAIDAIVRQADGVFIEVQIKARSKDIREGNAALFAAITHELRKNYWFVFYSARMDTKWMINSEEFIKESHQNKNSKNAVMRSIWFNGEKRDKKTGEYYEYIEPQYRKYVANDFSILRGNES